MTAAPVIRLYGEIWLNHSSRFLRFPDPEEWVFETARAGELIPTEYCVNLTFRFDDSEARFSDLFVVFDDCSEEVIIGAKTLQSCRIILDFENEEIRYRKTAERLRVI